MTSVTEGESGMAIGLDALTALDATDVLHRNAHLTALGNAVFDLGGAEIFFTRSTASTGDNAVPAVWLHFVWNGATLLAGGSAALAELFTQSLADQSVEQLGEAALDLLGQVRLAPMLPTGLVLNQVALTKSSLQAGDANLIPLGVWSGRHVGTKEASGHELQLWGDEALALQSLLLCFGESAKRRLPSPLARMPIALPLEAARWHVPLDILTDLSTGDVLVLN